jgi:hypothetical protein
MAVKKFISPKVLAVAVLAAAAAIAWSLLYGRLNSRTAAPVGESAAAPAAQSPARFSLPHGSQTYQIVEAAGVWPKILQATINPPDVHVGDVQKLEVVVQDSSPIVSVVAKTQLDHGAKEIPLNLLGPASAAELPPVKYAVDGKGRVIALDEPQPIGLAASDGAVQSAVAAEPPTYTYAGEWTVGDTHDTFYRTAFIVKDAAGRQNSVTIAWSDACGIPPGGNWTMSTNCTISSTDGVDNGNATLSAGTLTLNATFAWNPGQSVTLSGGSIAIGSGGQLLKTYLWVKDADADGSPSAAAGQCAASAASGCAGGATGWERRSGVGATSTSTGPNYYLNASEQSIAGYNNWANYGNAAGTANGTYATVALAVGATSTDLLPYNPAFNIPLNSQINGIKIEIYRHASVANTIFDRNDAPGTGNNGVCIGGLGTGSIPFCKQSGTAWATADEWDVYGGATDTWGGTWPYGGASVDSTSTSNIPYKSSYNLELSIAVKNKGTGSATAYVDAARVTVYYTYPVISTSTPDCNDNNINVQPFLAYWWGAATTTNMNLTTHLYDGGGEVNFDYNCDGQIEEYYNYGISTMTCEQTCSPSCIDSGSGTDGWVSGDPGCGNTGDETAGCYNSGVCQYTCADTLSTFSVTQTCQ